MKYISDYITRSEYECRCCGQLPPDLFANQIYVELFDIFKAVRERKGSSIYINSGFRCPKHNLVIGGSLRSVHLFGLALDMDCDDDRDVDKLYEIIREVSRDVRIGIYKGNKTFIHMDIGYKVNPRLSRFWNPGYTFYGKSI
jgi:uncharacterized protein YcbK (DUF882 family)